MRAFPASSPVLSAQSYQPADVFDTCTLGAKRLQGSRIIPFCKAFSAFVHDQPVMSIVRRGPPEQSL
jgi:hypothetical protein